MLCVTSVTNLDAKWTPYTGYVRRALGRVQKQWEDAMIESRLPLPPVETVITVVFWVSSDGRVSRIADVKMEPESNGGNLFVSAITRSGTFDPWTEDMKKLFGAEDRMTFTFHYEDPPTKTPNKPAPRNAGSRPSSDDSSAPETPSSPGPLGRSLVDQRK